MFTKVSKFTLKPGVREEATQVMQSLQERIMALNGMVSFLSILGEERTGMVIVVSSSRAVWESNAARTAQIWSNFAPYLAEMPKHNDFDTVALWTKPDEV